MRCRDGAPVTVTGVRPGRLGRRSVTFDRIPRTLHALSQKWPPGPLGTSGRGLSGCSAGCLEVFLSRGWALVVWGEWCSRSVLLCPTLVARQTPPSMGFSRQEYWSGLPFPSPGIEPLSPECPALAGRFFTTEPPG